MNAAGRSRIDAPEQGRAATPIGKAEEQRQVRLSPLLHLWPFVRRYLRRVIAASAALLVAALATLAIPLAVRGIIDHGFSAEQVDLIGRYFTLMIGVVIVLAGASSMRFYLVTIIGERVVADLRSAVFAHLTRLSPGFFDGAKTGEVLSRLTADTTQIKSAVGASVSIALRNLVLFVGAAAMMVVTSPRLSGFVLGAIPLIVLPLVAFGRAVRRRSRSAQDTLAEASAYAGELIGGVRTLQAFGNEALASARFTASVERAFAAARHATRARAILTAFAIFLVFSSVVLILWVGAQDVMTGAMSPGRLGQFVLYAVFAAGALGELSQVWGEISQASGAAERLVEILAIPADIKAPAKPIALRKPVRGRVQFDHVRFSYQMRPDGPVLDHVSFTVEPGEKVAIVGPSGAGKSTIFHLLLRFYDPTEGSISFDGVDLRDLDPAELRGHLALVSQDVSIFSGSAAENIGFGRPNASRAEIEQAAALAQADEFIRNLPQGFDTALGERGITLSGGQRQRIAIARAILREAPLLLLDEATSALDAESETLVQKALEHSMRGRTTLVIAHRLATVLSCDRILVMDQGRIVEQGHHDQLAAGQGLYARLAKLQFQGI